MLGIRDINGWSCSTCYTVYKVLLLDGVDLTFRRHRKPKKVNTAAPTIYASYGMNMSYLVLVLLLLLL